MAFGSQGPATEAAKVIQGTYIHNHNNYYELYYSCFKSMGLTCSIFDVGCSCGMLIKLRTLLGNTAYAQTLLPVRLVVHACRCQQCGHNNTTIIINLQKTDMSNSSNITTTVMMGGFFKITGSLMADHDHKCNTRL